MDNQMISLLGIPLDIEYTCKYCGNVLEPHKQDELWMHECFSSIDMNTHIFDIDANNRVSVESCKDVDDAENHDSSNMIEPASVAVLMKPNKACNSAGNRGRRSKTKEVVKQAVPQVQKGNNASCTVNSDSTLSNMDAETEYILKQLLISEVKANPLLWDIRLPVMERAKMKVLQAFVEIGKIIGVTAAAAQKIWEDLKNKYKEVKRLKDKYKASGLSTESLGAVQRANIEFPYYEDMTFLDDVVDPIETTDSLPNSPTNVDGTMAQYNRLTRTNSRKRSKASEKDTSCDSFERQVLGLLQENKDPEDEELSTFAQQLKHGMKRIPVEHRFDVQMDLLQFLRNKIHQYSTTE